MCLTTDPVLSHIILLHNGGSWMKKMPLRIPHIWGCSGLEFSPLRVWEFAVGLWEQAWNSSRSFGSNEKLPTFDVGVTLAYWQYQDKRRSCWSQGSLDGEEIKFLRGQEGGRGDVEWVSALLSVGYLPPSTQCLQQMPLDLLLFLSSSHRRWHRAEEMKCSSSIAGANSWLCHGAKLLG